MNALDLGKSSHPHTQCHPESTPRVYTVCVPRRLIVRCPDLRLLHVAMTHHAIMDGEAAARPTHGSHAQPITLASHRICVHAV